MAGVSVTTRSNIADADGSSTVFNFTFFAYSADTIKVYSVLDDVLTPITTGITKNINSSFVGGNVTFAVAPADAVGEILLRREVDYTQDTEIADLTRYKESAIEAALNTIVLQIQQLAEESARTIKYSEAADVTDTTIEAPVDGKAAVFDGVTGRLKPGPSTADIEDAEQAAIDAIAAAATAVAAQAAAAASAAAALASQIAAAASAAAAAGSFMGTSTTSLLIGTGSKVFTTQAGLNISVGQWVIGSSQADVANHMIGQVTAYTGTSLTINSTKVGGSGTKADWNIALTGSPGTGSGDMLLGTAQSVTALKTFDKDMFAMKGTGAGKTTLSTANASGTDYTATLPAKSGTIAMTSDITGGGKIQSSLITASGTFTTSANITAATVFKVTVQSGGGGGGGAAAGLFSAASGGSGGGCAVHYINNLAASTGYSATIGAGGSAGSAGNNNGGSGGNSSIVFGGTTISSTGGSAGQGSAASAAQVGVPVSGGAPSGTYTFGYHGGEGAGAVVVASAVGRGGKGGESHMGFSPRGEQNPSSAGSSNLTDYGSGGTGGVSLHAANAVAGGAGAPGAILIEWTE